MGPISAVGAGSARPPYALTQPSMDPVGLSGRPSASAGLSPSRGSEAIAQLFSAVSQLLNGTGNLDTQQTMQLLIALMILMALLRDSGEQQAQSFNALSPQGNGAQGMQLFSFSSSSTTLSIEQSSTTVIWAGTGDYSGQASAAPQATGSNVDLKA